MLGDLITATALIQPIKRQYPEARIFFLARPAFVALLTEIPDVAGVIPDTQPYDGTTRSPEFTQVLAALKSHQFDVMINLWEHPRYAVLAKAAGIKVRIGHAIGWRNWLYHTHCVRLDYQDYHRHKVQMNLALLTPLGVSASDSRLQLQISDPSMEEVAEKYPLMNSPYRVVAVDAGAKVKCWVDSEIKPVLTAMLDLDPSPLVLLGGGVANASEATLDWINTNDRIINLAGKTSLVEVSALIKKATYFVGPDSGLSHIAAALQCPAVVIYRTRTQNCFHWAPWLSPHVIYKQQNICLDSCVPLHCPCPGREFISPDRVVALIRELEHTTTGTLAGQVAYWELMGHQAGIYCDPPLFESYRAHVPLEWNAIHLDPKASITSLKNRMVAGNINVVVVPHRRWSLKLWIARIWTSNLIHFLPVVRGLN
jgi:ADP-heptose:LPS heptosyltransferase